jgi:L-fuculose-phosphate aldolase
VYRQPADEPGAVREQLVRYSVRLLSDGLAIGRAGNLSVRTSDGVLITPSGVSYHELTAAGICQIRTDGAEPLIPAAASSESPMHLAVYGATQAGAVVHTHSPEVVALSAVHDELPAIHYAITDLGGPVRVARYQRFGSDDLARAVVGALEGRRAAILANHGAVTYGATLAQAYDRALLVEWLARVYRLALSAGTPRILSVTELDEVTEHARRIRYGTAQAGDQRSTDSGGATDDHEAGVRGDP